MPRREPAARACMGVRFESEELAGYAGSPSVLYCIRRSLRAPARDDSGKSETFGCRKWEVRWLCRRLPFIALYACVPCVHVRVARAAN